MRIVGKPRLRAQTHRTPIVNLGFANRAFIGAASIRPPNLVGWDDALRSPVDGILH
jgi:hypothetical protein